MLKPNTLQLLVLLLMSCLEKKFWVLFIFSCKTRRILGLFLYTPATCHSFISWTYRMAASLRKRNLNEEYHWRVNVKLSNTKSNKRERKISSDNTEAQVTTPTPSLTACHSKGWTEEKILQLVTWFAAGRFSSSSGEVSSLAQKALPCVERGDTLSLALPSTCKVTLDASLPVSLPAWSSLPWGMEGKKDIFVFMWSVMEYIHCFFFFFFS